MAINVNLNFHKIERERTKNLNQRIGHEIAYYLGHKSTNTTEQIYVRKDNDVSKKLGKKLQERMG